jgi:hypothetical protein
MSDIKTQMELSKRCAVPFFINIVDFARKHEAQQVLVIY